MTGRVRWAALLLVALGSFFGGGWLLRRGIGARAAAPGLAPDPSPVMGNRLFQDVLRHVRSHAVDSLDEAAIYRLAAAGMLDELDDPYAALVEVAKRTAADSAPLGLYLDRVNDHVVVVAVRPGSPAQAAGIRGGDIVVDVGGTRVDDRRPEDVAALLAGPAGSEVTIGLGRPGVRRARVTVTREPVPDLPPPSLTVAEGVGYLRVAGLRSGAARRVEGLLDSLRASGARGLVLDLRGVVEGDLAEAVALAGLFLGPNALVMATRGRASGDSILARNPAAGSYLEGPMVVLVDRGTSGPAEVVAGALQDNDRALLVGEPTFGRGGELTVYPLGDGMGLRLTTAHWITPSGRVIQRGLHPAATEGEEGEGDEVEVARPEFRTVGGRTVLGGGGIVPDREVPSSGGEAAEGDPALALARQLLSRARTTRTLLALDPA